ncbi:MAG: DEAD/DEAH box helicase, partial [Actinomycetota bacterium]|nr:DEAD/DEAH box helicase [Actinomycetota bacterium]
MNQTFAELGVSEPVVRALAARGITQPFAIQKRVIADVLAGRDVLASSPTGSGKTLAFAAPIADRIEATDRRPAALILAPTRELASQIVEEGRTVAHARALRIAAVYGGVGIEKQAREAAKAHILVATPGRLEDLIARGALTLKHVRILVLDEADRMLDMGFKPAVDRIVKQTPAARQTLFFSATLAGEPGRIAAAYTQDPTHHDEAPPKRAEAKIEHRFVRVEKPERVGRLIEHLDDGDRGLALVFVRTKRGADRLVKSLNREGVEAVAMHGDKSQKQREKALARFEAGRVSTLVATDVAARGIDVDDISHVIQFDPPDGRDTYVHRVGRTGRAGRTGVGITFVEREAAADVEQIAKALRLEREFGETGLARTHAPRPASEQRSG